MYAPKEPELRPGRAAAGVTPLPGAAADYGYRSAQANPVRGAVPPETLPQTGRLGEIGPADVIAWLRGGLGWIAACLLLCLAGAVVFAQVTPQRYTVYTDILIDPSNLNVVRDDVFTSNPQRDAQLLEVESKLRILTSRNVLTRVIDKLDLTNDPEFNKPSVFEPLLKLFSLQPESGDRRLGVMRALSERVVARREERSFVVVMSFWAGNSEKAVAVSNAIVDAFETELFQSASESAGRVVRNMNERLEELRRNVTEAEQKIEEFRRARGLQLVNGEPVSTRLSNELNTQVLEAQQRFIQSETRHTQMSAAIAERRTASSSIFDSPSMTSLRAQYNTLQQQIGSMSATYGARHPQLISAQSELQAAEASLQREARRILTLAKADMDRDRATLAMLRGRANAERSRGFTDSEELVQLRDLQRDARAKAALYETHLARTQQISERQQIDTTNVRVISRPVPPKAPSWPPRLLILLGAAGFLGLALGVGVALLLGAWRHLRTPRPAAA